MEHFLSWSEWLTFREDNARKRAVRAALSGTGDPLPGSYAACPSTNPQAMDSAKKNGVIKKDLKFRFKEHEGQRPDYSFDRWIQQAKEFGDDLNKMVTRGQKDEKDIDRQDDAEKEEIDKEKQAEPADKDAGPDKNSDQRDEDSQKRDSAWKTLRQIHKERLKDFEQKDSGNKQSAAGKKSSGPSLSRRQPSSSRSS